MVLVRLINLPLQLRNRADKLLVLGLYNTRFAKENGGVTRMISGVGPDGTYYDEVCLRTDLEALRRGVEMEVSHLVQRMCEQLVRPPRASRLRRATTAARLHARRYRTTRKAARRR